MTSTDNTTETHAVPVTDEELASLIKMIGDNDCSAPDLFTNGRGFEITDPSSRVDLDLISTCRPLTLTWRWVRLERFMLSKDRPPEIFSQKQKWGCRFCCSNAANCVCASCP